MLLAGASIFFFLGVWAMRELVWLILSKFIFKSTRRESVIDDGRDFTSHLARNLRVDGVRVVDARLL